MTRQNREPCEPRVDPLIDDIRAIRERLWRESGESIANVAEELRKIERQHVDRLVRHVTDRSGSERRSA